MANGSSAGRTDRRPPRGWAAVVVLAWLASPAHAMPDGLSGIVTLTSQYIYRGLAVSGGDAAIQLGLDYEHDSGLFGGVWASSIDIASSFSERDTELDFYLGYHFAPEGPLALTATVMRYTFPGQTGPIDYDYGEALFAATLYDSLSLEIGYARELYGLDGTGRHWELRYDLPVESAWVISAGLGRNDLTDYGGSRYLHWDLGASARYQRLMVDLRWYDNERPGAAVGGQSAGSTLVLALSAAF